jgi:hypothetical protein
MAQDGADIIQLLRTKEGDLVAEGLRLIRAFMQIRDPLSRSALIASAERMANLAPPLSRQDET